MARPARGDRAARLLALHHGPGDVARKTEAIGKSILNRSATVTTSNFVTLAESDLELLFTLYDSAFFEGSLGAMVRDDSASLTFRLSKRMTRTAGTTSLRTERRRQGFRVATRELYEITISTVLLFGTFNGDERPVTIGGLVVRDRLEALQRVFEHELLHLAEFLVWGRSSCAEANFHGLSRRIFGHSGVRHDLVTPRETAAATFGIRVGDRVSFEHEGVRRLGRVNRITKRATVLVEQPGGRLYTDGKTYATYYVPVVILRKENGTV